LLGSADGVVAGEQEEPWVEEKEMIGRELLQARRWKGRPLSSVVAGDPDPDLVSLAGFLSLGAPIQIKRE